MFTRPRKLLAGLAFGLPTFREKAAQEHEAEPIEQKINRHQLLDGGLADPAQQRQVRGERILCGMGSGGPEDVNTYAMYDALPQAERDKIRAHMKPSNVLLPEREAQKQYGEDDDVPVGGIADIVDRNYDITTKGLKLKGLNTDGDAETH